MIECNNVDEQWIIVASHFYVLPKQIMILVMKIGVYSKSLILKSKNLFKSLNFWEYCNGSKLFFWVHEEEFQLILILVHEILWL